MSDSGDSSLRVLIFPDPLRFANCIEETHPVGESILELLAYPDEAQRACLLIISDGDIVPQELWGEVVPRGHLVIKKVPADRNALRLIAFVVVAVVASWAGQWQVWGAYGGVAQASIGIVGVLAVNALIPPAIPEIEGADGPTTLAALTGQSNQVAAFSPIPRILGRPTFYPPIPMTALPYTELVGQDQYLRMMVCLGYGPLQIGGVTVGAGLPLITENTTLTGSPIKIGGTSIDQFDDLQFQIGDPDDVTLFTTNIVEASVNVPLDHVNDPTSDEQTLTDNVSVIQTTDNDTSEISLDLFFPGLFTASENGNTRWARVTFEVEYSVASAENWVSLGTFIAQSIERKPVRMGRRYNLPSSGQWDIRLTRVNTFYGRDTSFFVDCTWTVLRSIKRNMRPFDVDDTVVMALRIRATDQLGGRIDRLSVEATSVVPVWNGSAWVDAPTRNPAWLYTDVLSGVATRTAAAKASIDTTALSSWASWCDTNGLTYDGVIDADGTVFDRAREVASAGLGSWHITDDAKYSIVRDEVSTPKMVVTPRNSFGFTTEYAFHQLPHALRVQFMDPDRWEPTERLAYDDGYSEDGAGDTEVATVFEQLQTVGVWDSDQAWKIGRYHLAQLRLRPETYSFGQDIQHLAYQRGDTIELSNDVILVGLKGARITAVNSTSEIEVDEVLFMEPGGSYGVRIQKLNGLIVNEAVETVSPSTSTLTFDNPVSDLSVGEHLVFGEFGSETIEAKITRIEPQGDFKAQITAVPAAENIFDAWTGDIPEFDPVLTDPIDTSLLPPTIPTIISVTSGFTTSLPGEVGVLRRRVVIAFEMPPGLVGVYVQARVRSREVLSIGTAIGVWRIVAEVTSDAGVIFINDLEADQSYEFALRSYSGNRFSSWTGEVGHFFNESDQRRIAPLPLDVRVGEGVTNIVFSPNQDASGSAQNGYIRFSQGHLILPDGTDRQVSYNPSTLVPFGIDQYLITPYTTTVPPDGTAWIMSGASSVLSRFGGSAAIWGTAADEGFFVTRFNWAQDKWFAVRGDGLEIEYVPVDSDVIVAQVQKTSPSGGIDKIIIQSGGASVTGAVGYEESPQWTRAKNAGSWTPIATENDGIVNFKIGATTIGTRAVTATLTEATGVITLSSVLQASRDQTSVVFTSNNTTSPSALVTHIPTGATATLSWSSVQSGTDGAGTDGEDGADGDNGAPGIAPFSAFRGQVGAFTNGGLRRNETGAGSAAEGEIGIDDSVWFLRDGDSYDTGAALTLNTPYESTVRTVEQFYVVLGETNASTRFGAGFDAHRFFCAEYVAVDDEWVAVGNAAQEVSYVPLNTDVIVGIGTRPSIADAGIRNLAQIAMQFRLDSDTAPIFIENAAIESALIGSLAADKITAGNVTVALNLTTGNLQVSNTGKFFSGRDTWDDNANGYYFDATPRFQLLNAANDKGIEFDDGVTTLFGDLVATGNVQINAVSEIVNSSTAEQRALTTTFASQEQVTITVGLNADGDPYPVLIIVSALFISGTDDALVLINRDTVGTIWDVHEMKTDLLDVIPFTTQIQDDPGVGTHTYSLFAREVSDPVDIAFTSITVIALKDN